MHNYPPRLPITPHPGPVRGSLTPPGSKSISNRALVLAALCSRDAPITLAGLLRSEDTEVMLAALDSLGYRVETDWPSHKARIHRGDRPLVPADAADLFVANSGTTMRFLTAMCALGRGTYRLRGVPRMHERPIGDLLDALDDLGIRASCESPNRCPPVVVHGGTWRGGRIAVRGDVSSQFLTGLLLAAPFAPTTTIFELSGDLVSKPYVEMTTRMMHDFHLRVSSPTESSYLVPGQQDGEGYLRGEYVIEPDASAASYLYAAAAITGGTVTVPHLGTRSMQGDVHFVDVLERMGCRVDRSPDSITVTGGKLRGIDVGMSDISDTVMTAGAVALFAEGPTTIRNVGHIRHKETDRIAALAAELRKVGAAVEEFADGLTITPGVLRGAAIDTYKDHRMAMSLALVGLRVPGVVINDPGCVAKTYPDFFADLDRLRG